MLRNAVAEGTELGMEAKEFMDAGLLVPDEVIIRLIEERLNSPDAPSGVLFDGFPRTIPQAEALSRITEVSAVISIEVPDENIIERIVGRRMDPETGEIYHISFKPPPPEIIHRLIHRKDDTEQTVRKRLDAYHMQTKPLGEWYQELGLLTAVDGTGSIESVSESVATAVRNF
jgi:adenylate kinase